MAPWARALVAQGVAQSEVAAARLAFPFHLAQNSSAVRLLGDWLDFDLSEPLSCWGREQEQPTLASDWHSGDSRPQTANHPPWSSGKCHQPVQVACVLFLVFLVSDGNPLSFAKKVKVLSLMVIRFHSYSAFTHFITFDISFEP